jgi:serine/threonine protein kinase
MNEEALFAEALGKQGAARAAFLDEHCKDDVDLRKRLEALLRAHDHPDPFLEPAAPVATVDEPLRETAGAVIGPYKLIEQIGEGGMGTVWMAQQTEPVKRVVALKVIKAGMDSKQVIARFDAERQALALMDHPNIAKVLDGGATGIGRPYFVMDLVKGVPITRYCDEHRLTPRQRLELFVPVCQAVQHAHQKGIIHRDLKPSNVLVALYDGRPVPKVIDFGVAKAAGQSLTDKTLVTGFGNIVGTLEYMSPEQAEINQLDIDTRSDIYSLGVLVYELLTGSPPFTKKDLEKAGMLEMLRVIREQEPAKPSTKLSTAEGLPTLAANRGTEPAKLTKLVRGELDWIVMKALEKDRNRRYETANGFAMDLQRYLADQAVLACPPSMGYRLGKFARRNKATLAMAGVVSLAVLLGIVGLVIANYRITHERDLAQREHELAEANLQKARMAVEDYLTTVSENTLLKSSVPGLQPLRKELLQTALRYYQGFARDHQDDPTLRFELAAATFRVGVITAEIDSHEKGLQYLVQARDLLQKMADANPSRADYQKELGRCQIRIGYVTAFSSAKEAIPSLKQGIEALEVIALDHAADDLLQSDLAFGYHYLGLALLDVGTYGEARQHTRRAIELRQELAGRNPTQPRYRSDLALSMSNLANIQFHENQLHEALETERQAEAIQQALVREHPWDTSMRRTLALSISGQGSILRSLGRKTEGLARDREASEIMHKVSTENPSDIDLQRQAARRLAEYAQSLVDENDLAPAEQALARAQEHAEVAVKENPKDFIGLSALSSIHRARGNILGKKGKPAEALRELRDAVTIDERLAPERAAGRYDLACSLSLCCAMAGRMGSRAEADRYAQRALVELRRAWEQGWKDIQGMEQDADLDALRSRSDFQQLMRSLRENAGKAGR